MTKPAKLTRKQITEGLKQTPIEHILVGANNAHKVNLTKKQKDFARKVAEGKPKAQAYRETYNTQASKQNQAVQAHKTASNPKIATMIESFRVANEAREYLIPAQIRTMAIQNLVSIAINDEEKTSNKLKALELIGKMSEVSLFSETKTHVHLHSSNDIRGQLLEGLKLAFSTSRNMNDLAKRKAESLLVELSEPQALKEIEADQEDDSEISPPPSDSEILPTPPTTVPKKQAHSVVQDIHSIPHIQSDSDSVTPPADEVTIPSESKTCERMGVNPDASDDVSEGVGVDDSQALMAELSQQTPPVNISNEKSGE